MCLRSVINRNRRRNPCPTPLCDSIITNPDLDAWTSGSTEPVSVGAEAQGVDDVTAIQCVQVLVLIQIPKHGLTILTNRRTFNMN